MIHGQQYLKELAEHWLDFSEAFNAQDPAVISDICAQVPLPKFIRCIITAGDSCIHWQADKHFPPLKHYVERWATTDFLMTLHKNIKHIKAYT